MCPSSIKTNSKLLWHLFSNDMFTGVRRDQPVTHMRSTNSKQSNSPWTKSRPVQHYSYLTSRIIWIYDTIGKKILISFHADFIQQIIIIGYTFFVSTLWWKFPYGY